MWVLKYISYRFNQLFCKHKYIQVLKYTGRNIEADKQITFDITYACVKCGKVLFVDMDEESQL